MITSEVELPNGYKVVVIEKSETIVEEIWKEKIYEKKYTIQSGMNVIDIGANQGFFSLYAAHKGAHVYAYEPENRNFTLLSENVNRNNLNQMIVCNKCALGKSSGYVDLYMEDFELPFASGMVSTSLKYASQMNLTSDNKNMQHVRCISLEEALNNIVPECIDLMKIDCEGAEIEILSGISNEKMKRVRNIVMETHDVYPLSQLYKLLTQLGFSVTYLEKPSGLFRTGYLFAVNAHYQTELLDRCFPVAILNLPQYAFKDDVVVFDANQSFIAGNDEQEITCKWFINSEEEKVYSFNLTRSFNKCEPQIIEIEISDQRGQTDGEKQCIWIFEKNYNLVEDFIILPDNAESKDFVISNTQNYKIPQTKLPHFWMPDKIVIGFFNIDNDSIVKGSFNGEEFIIERGYTEREFKTFPYGVDLNFSITAFSPSKIGIKWWWIKNDNLAFNAIEEGNCFTLGSISSDNFVEVFKCKKMKILKDGYPKDWVPAKIKFVITAWTTNGVLKQLDGYVECQGKKINLSNWYTIIEVPDFIKENNVEFVINSKESQKMKVNWWAE
jgi:FkbM family methyltransferase